MSFYSSKNIHVFKDAISIPGLVEQYLFRPLRDDIHASFMLISDQALYTELRDSVVGGPSLVFNEFAKAGETLIHGNPDRICQRVIGMDGNALYLWCLGQEMPTGAYVDRIIPPDSEYRYRLPEAFFGFAKVDIHVPDSLRNHFSHFPPIFIKDAEEGKIKSVMDAKEIILFSPLLRWYLEHGLVITNIHRLVSFEPNRCFQSFVDEVTEARQQGGDSILADTMKLFGNSAYGRSLMKREDFSRVRVVEATHLQKHVMEPSYVEAHPLGNDLYEVTRRCTRIVHHSPIQIGLAVYSYAKLRMLQFYYDFLCQVTTQDRFMPMHMDTDSLYMAITGDRLEDIVTCHPFRYEQLAKQFLSRDPSTRRTPGLFKVEFSGTELVELAPKLYSAFDSETQKHKMSSKGVCQEQVAIGHKRVLELMNDQEVWTIRQDSVRLNAAGELFTVRQSKRAWQKGV
ncbi:uncharacterized protein BJ171DRAFT_549374 [Polychytrium aggregatum]|uniref:uncharacterized protein n=1 Tax=Polychytrium aggregatum TaxID=110093 RepID=UPI0022FF0280|nr:uncharacterized protein BJ171DRAFT_549374 [Polychytrium aggregatum]KAI9188571.1 hypothetical protein BJ171DRAFT_549374 [Polychytrium aggregatum]